MDDHGDESYAKIPVNHRTAADVTDEALEYYQDVWAFLDPNSLLFYFAPVTDWLIAAEVKNLLVVELREKESSPLHCVRV